jgi:hypothetical protein
MKARERMIMPQVATLLQYLADDRMTDWKAYGVEEISRRYLKTYSWAWAVTTNSIK